MKGIDIFCASPASTAILSGIVRRRDAILRRQSSVPCSSQLPVSPRPSADGERRTRNISASKQSDLRRKSSAYVDDLKSRTGSARYLLSDHKSLGDELHAHHRELVSSDCNSVSSNDSVPPALKLKPSRSNRSREQIVVLKVAIHCKGCEGKVRKHISKMEGVKAFNIDLATKKVTIMGNVTPSGVLESVSKVKTAQFWQSCH